MCGRYMIDLHGAAIAEVFDAVELDRGFTPRWNAAPTQLLPIVARGSGEHDGRRVLEAATWGLVPGWARGGGRAARPFINARAETLCEKPAFRRAFTHGRVLVPMTGFYEWRATAGERAKAPHLLRVHTPVIDPETGAIGERQADPGEPAVPVALAGIAERWTSPDGLLVTTFGILTTMPNELVAPIHDRMPVILEPDAARAWIDTPSDDAPALLDLLRPLPADRMELWPVDRAVGNARIDHPGLALPIAS